MEKLFVWFEFLWFGLNKILANFQKVNAKVEAIS
jgi:hypothetical protein